MLSLRVVKSTICSNPLSATISKKVWFVLIGYCLFIMDCSDQLMSGKLKSAKEDVFLMFCSDGIYFILCLVQICVVSFIRWSVESTYEHFLFPFYMYYTSN